MLRKKLAIFKHESQKDKALFPGHDEREFWVRAEERHAEHGPDLQRPGPARILRARGLRTVLGSAVSRIPEQHA